MSLAPLLQSSLAIQVHAFAAMAADTAPDALVKSTVSEVMSVLQQTKDKRKLLELAEQKVLPNFDFTEMTRLAVGRSWRDANDAQKKSRRHTFTSPVCCLRKNNSS